LDEIEKAHPEVFNVLLQILDDGRLTDNKGRTVNFKNTIVIMTSNLGASLIMEKTKLINPENKEKIHQEIENDVDSILKQTLRPEFLNRVDEIIVFHALTREHIREIVGLQFEMIQNMVVKKEIRIEMTPEAADFLAEAGFDPAFGARPLKRSMQKLIADPLAIKLLDGEFHKGDVIEIGVEKNSLAFELKTS
jgi:ATP-dependent Clp protease ATP-binding subunit ClpB